jgi:hypothetical protein
MRVLVVTFPFPSGLPQTLPQALEVPDQVIATGVQGTQLQQEEFVQFTVDTFAAK